MPERPATKSSKPGVQNVFWTSTTTRRCGSVLRPPARIPCSRAQASRRRIARRSRPARPRRPGRGRSAAGGGAPRARASLGPVSPAPRPACARSWPAGWGSTRSCGQEDGRLLHVLAGRSGVGRVAEIGTGCRRRRGVDRRRRCRLACPLFTAEFDQRLRGSRRRRSSPTIEDVLVLAGAWREAAAARGALRPPLRRRATHARRTTSRLVVGLLAPRRNRRARRPHARPAAAPTRYASSGSATRSSRRSSS